MLKPLIALSGLLIVVSLTTATSVQSYVSPPGSGGGGGETSDKVGEPFHPDGQPKRRGVPVGTESGESDSPDSTPTTGSIPKPAPGNPPANPGTSPASSGAAATAGGPKACGDELGGLKRVRAGAVRAVGYGDSIDVVPICVGRALGSEQEDIGGLRAPIAQNETLMGALKAAGGYSAEHVVGIQLNGESVVLYVH